jgi:starvation-inducible DNA-binding protein
MRPQIQKNQEKQISPATKLGIVLNRLLADNINLKLQAKQAHWNIKGENFIALHQLFDGVAEEADKYADMIAERIVQIGGVAAGTLEAISKHTKLEEYPVNMEHKEQYIRALSAAIKVCVSDSQKAIDLSTEVQDQITSDLFTEVARGLDKQRWLVESNLTIK